MISGFECFAFELARNEYRDAIDRSSYPVIAEIKCIATAFGSADTKVEPAKRLTGRIINSMCITQFTGHYYRCFQPGSVTIDGKFSFSIEQYIHFFDGMMKM